MKGECRRNWKYRITGIEATEGKLLRTITLYSTKLFDEEMLRRRMIIEQNDGIYNRIHERLKALKKLGYSGISGDRKTPSHEEIALGQQEADEWEKTYANMRNLTFDRGFLNFDVPL